jgi:hypothetical protein
MSKSFHKMRTGKISYSKKKNHDSPKKRDEKKKQTPKKENDRDMDGYKNFMERLKQRYTIVYPSPRKFGDYPIAVTENRNGMTVTYEVDIPSDKRMMKQIQSFPNHFNVPRKTHEIEDLVRKAAYYGNLHQDTITSRENYVPLESDTVTYELIEPNSADLFYSYLKETAIGPKKFMIAVISIPDNVKNFYTEQLSVTLRKIEYYKSIAEISENGYREKIEHLQNKIQFRKKKFGLEIIEKLKQGQKLYVPTYLFSYEKKKSLHAIHKYGSILFSTDELSAVIPTTVTRISGNQEAVYTLAPITDEYFIQKVLYYVYRSPMENFYGKYKRSFPIKPTPQIVSLIETPPDIYLPYAVESDDTLDRSPADSFFWKLKKDYPSRIIPPSVYEDEELQRYFIAKTNLNDGIHQNNDESPPLQEDTISEKENNLEESVQERFQEYKKYFKSAENMKIIQSIFEAELKKAIEENPRLKYTGPNAIEPDQRIIELFPSYLHSKKYIPVKDWEYREDGVIREKENTIALFSLSRKGKKTLEFTLEKPYMRGFSIPSEEDKEKLLDSLTEKEKKVFLIPIRTIEQDKEIAVFPPRKINTLQKDLDNAVGYWLKNIPYVYFQLKKGSYRVYLTQNKEICSFLENLQEKCPEMQPFMYYTTQNERIFDYIGTNYSILYEIRMNGETIPLPSLSFSAENVCCFALPKKKNYYFYGGKIKIMSIREKTLFQTYEYFHLPPFREIVKKIDYNTLLRYLSPQNIITTDIVKIDEKKFEEITTLNSILSPMLPLLKENISFLFSQEKDIHLFLPAEEKDFFWKIKKGEPISIKKVETEKLCIIPLYIFTENEFSVCLIAADYATKEYFIIGEEVYIEEGTIIAPSSEWNRVELDNVRCPVLHLGKVTILFLFWVLHFIYLNSAIDIKNINRILIEYVERLDMDPRFYLIAYFLEYSKIFKEIAKEERDETESFHLKDATL